MSSTVNNLFESFDITKDEAIQSFEESNLIGISKTDAAIEVSKGLATPRSVVTTPALGRYIAENPVNAAAIKDDVKQLSDVERLWGKIKTTPKRVDISGKTNRKAFDLMTYDNNLKFVSGIKNDLTKEDSLREMGELDKELQDLSLYDKEDDFAIDALPMGAGVFFQIADALAENPKTAGLSFGAGLIGGPLTAIGLPIMTTSAKDNFELTSGQIYKQSYLDLTDDEKVKVNPEEIMHIALGAGVISGGIEFVSVGALGKTVKESIAKSKIGQKLATKQIVNMIRKGATKNETLLALKSIGQTVAKQFAEQGLTEAAQTTIEQTALTAAKPGDMSYDQWLANIDGREILKSAMVGTVAGVMGDVAGRPVGEGLGKLDAAVRQPLIDKEMAKEETVNAKPEPKPTIEIMEFRAKLEQETARLEQLKANVKQVVETLDTVSVKDTIVEQDVLTSIIPEDARFYINHDAIKELESSKQGLYDGFERITGNKLTEDNDIYGISGRELISLYKQDDRILDYIAERPDQDPLIVLKAADKKFANDQRINALLEQMNVENITPEEQAKIKSSINEILESTLQGVTGKNGFVLQPFIDERLRQSFNPKELQQMELDVMEARKVVADKILQDEKDREYFAISLDVRTELTEQDVVGQINKEINEQSGFRLEEAFDPATEPTQEIYDFLRTTNPNYEQFSNDQILADIVGRHNRKRPAAIIGIDSKTMPENLQKLVIKENVKKKGAFVKNGLDWKHAPALAKLLGFKNERDMLQSLIDFPTKEDYFNTRYDEKLRDIFDNSAADLSSTQADYEKAFNNAKNNVEILKQSMKSKPELVRRLIRKLGRRIRTFRELQVASTLFTYALKTKDLVPMTFRRNQEMFLKKAADAEADGNFLDFWSYKEKEALNYLIEGNVRRLKKVIQSRVNRIKNLSSPENMKVLYKAGPEYVRAFMGIKNALSNKPFEATDLADVQTIIQPYVSEGLVVPPNIMKLYDQATRVQQGDLNGSEVLSLLNLMIQIHSVAKDAAIIKINEDVLSIAEIENKIQNDLESRAEYKADEYENLNMQDSEKKSFIIKLTEDTKDMYYSAGTSLLNIYNIVQNGLDRGFQNGFYYKLFVEKLLKGLEVKGQYDKTFNDWMKQAIKDTMGIEKFNKLDSETVSSSIFSNAFKNGVITRFQAMEMLGHYGSKSGRERVMSFLKISDEQTLLRFFEQNLTKDEIKWVSEMHKYFRNVDSKLYVKAAEELGIPAFEPITGLAYTINGQEMLGGYWPIQTKVDIKERSKAQMTDYIEALKNGNVQRVYSLDINTEDGHELSRTKNAKSPLSLGYQSFIGAVREKNHHHALRTHMLDISKILANQNIQKHLVNTLKKDKFAAMLGILQSFGTGQYDYDTIIGSRLDLIAGTWGKTLSKNMYSAYLGFGFGTAIRQFMSLPSMVDALAQATKDPSLLRGNKQALVEAFLPAFKMVLNNKSFSNTVKAIAEVDPQFAQYIERLSQKKGIGAWNSILNLEPTIDMREQGKGDLANFWSRAQDASLKHLSGIQLYINTIMWVSSYNLALSGKVQGIDKNDIESSRRFAMKNVNQLLSDSSGLDQSMLQQTTFGKIFLMFQNQLNLQSNQFMGGARRLNIEFKNKDARVTTKGMLGAAQTMIANSVGPAAIAAVTLMLWKAVTGVEDDKKKKDQDWVVFTIAEILKAFPWLRPIGGALTGYNEYGLDPARLQSGNVMVDLGVDATRMATTSIIAASSDEPIWTKELVKDAALLTSRAFGIPRINMLPTPLNERGQALQIKLIDKLLESTNLPSRKLILTKSRGGGVSLGLSAGDENGVTSEAAAAEPVEAPKGIEQNAALFKDAVRKLRDPDLTPEQRSLLEQTRDIAYSVVGYTNPEGNMITTRSGDIELTDQQRNTLTLLVDTIARFESNNYEEMRSASGAKGYFHFIDSTWSKLREEYPEYGLPVSPDLATKGQQYQVYWKYLGENLLHLRQLGQKWTAANIYLIHMMGFNDFKTFSEASDDQDLTDVLPTQFRWNGGIMAAGTKPRIYETVKDRLKPHAINAQEYLRQQNLLTLN